MYATVVSVRIDAGRSDDSHRELTEHVLPTVKATPGFISGYWYAPNEDRASAVIFWANERVRPMAVKRRPENM